MLELLTTCGVFESFIFGLLVPTTAADPFAALVLQAVLEFWPNPLRAVHQSVLSTEFSPFSTEHQFLGSFGRLKKNRCFRKMACQILFSALVVPYFLGQKSLQLSTANQFFKKDASFQSQLFFRETSKLFFHGILAVKVMELQKQRVILSYFPRLLLLGWTLFSIFTKQRTP